ncbi:hypothetical protein SFRURICE_010924 [Spodoptera frugiperda]|nr:hypothetical protein SFRURICE_010924 [Spodoptera frugiperda]
MFRYSPVSVAMAGCSEGGTVSERARALNVSNPAHSSLPPSTAATVMPSVNLRTENYRVTVSCAQHDHLLQLLMRYNLAVS